MASFCRIRAVLRSREGLSALPRRFTSSSNAPIVHTRCGSFSKVTGSLPSRLVNARCCTTKSSVDHVEGDVTATETDAAPERQLVEAIVSFNDDNDEGNSVQRRLNPRKPKLLRSKQAFLEMFEERLHEGEMSESSAYRCIRGCGNEMILETEETRRALLNHVWDVLKTKGLTFEINHYNGLLSVYVENNYEFSPLDFLSDLQKCQLQPNRITFALLMQGYCNHGKIDEALKLLNFIKEETSYASSETIYAALIDGHSINGDYDKALQVYEEMRGEGIEPGPYCYAALISVYARAGNMEELHKVFAAIADSGIHFDDATIQRILLAISLTEDSSITELVLTKLPEFTVWNIDIKSFVLRLFVKGHFTQAGKLLRHIALWNDSRNDNYQELSKHHLYLAKQSVEEARAVFTSFCEMGLEFNVIEDCLDYSYRINASDDSLSLIKELHANERLIKPHYFYPPLTQLCQKKDFNGVKECVKLMNSCQINVDQFMRRHIQKLMQTGEESIVNEFQESLKELGFDVAANQSNQSSGSTVMDSDPDAVLQFFDSQDVNQLDNWNTQAKLRQLLSRLDDEETAVTLFTKMSEAQASGTDNAILSFVSKMSRQQDSETKMSNFVIKLMENGVKDINSKTHTRVLSALQRAKFKTDFFNYIAKMKEHGMYADEHQYFQMLKMSATVGNSAAAQFCFDKIKESDMSRANCYAHLITAYGKDDVQRQSNNSQYAEKIIQLYKEAIDNEFRITGQALSYTLLSYLSKSDVESANDILQASGSGSPYMQSLVYNEYLRAYGKRRMTVESRELFERMKADDDLPNPGRFSYNQLFGVYKTEGNYQEIATLMREMQDNNITPDKFSYAERVKAHITAGDLSGAYDVLEAIEEEQCRPHLGTYMNIVRKCVHAGDTDGVKRGIKLVQQFKAGLVSDSELSHSVVFSKIKNGDFDAAAAEKETEKCELEPKIVRRICRGASLAGDVAYLLNIRDFLKRNDLLSPDIPDTALLRIYEKQEDIEKARALHQEKLANGDSISMEFKEIMDKMSEPRNNETTAVPRSEIPE